MCIHFINNNCVKCTKLNSQLINVLCKTCELLLVEINKNWLSSIGRYVVRNNENIRNTNTVELKNNFIDFTSTNHCVCDKNVFHNRSFKETC